MKVHLHHGFSETIPAAWKDPFLAAVEDNGSGMDSDGIKKALDPFFSDGKKHIHRKIGLGLPFLKQTIESCDGVFELQSKAGEGTTVRFALDLSHFDAPAGGNFISVICHMLGFSSEADVTIIHSVLKNNSLAEKRYNNQELIEVLGSLEVSQNLVLLKEFITSNEDELSV